MIYIIQPDLELFVLLIDYDKVTKVKNFLLQYPCQQNNETIILAITSSLPRKAGSFIELAINISR